MERSKASAGAPFLGLTALAACAAPVAPVVAPAGAPPPVVSRQGLETVLGHNARQLAAEFGPADLDVREGSARKLQFLSPVCVLDVYLYPPAGGGEPVVTYIDARLPDGSDMDRASCVAATARRSGAPAR